MRSPISDSLLRRVISRYPLENPEIVDAIEASKRNDSFLVEDASGKRYVLRRHRRNLEDDRVRFQLRFQQHLLERGFPTCKVIETSLGSPLVISGGRPWALFAYIEGSEYDFTRMTQVVDAARRLAEFHTVSDTFSGEEVVIDINPLVRQWWTDGERELRKLEEMFAGLGVEEELAFVRYWHSGLVGEWPLAWLDALPIGWVHGDYHGRNMVFVGDEMRGLFDFDVVHRGALIEDVAHALFMFGRESRAMRSIRPEVARLFLDEYHRYRPLQPNEVEALPMMAVLYWAPSACYYALLQQDGEDPTVFLRRHVSLMRDLHSEMARLNPILSG